MLPASEIPREKELAIRRSFKSDESLLTRISIGATGARQVYENLKRQGHRPLELERGSMSFKIWKKIKIRHILLTDVGNTVLDIFAGSNTTGAVAERLGRKWIAFELEGT